MSTEPSAEEIGPPQPPPSERPPPQPEGWRRDKAGREFVTIPGRRGPLYRRGEETIRERLERDQRPRDEKPRGKGKGKGKPTQPDAPKDADLKEIEKALAEFFASPAMFAGLAGDVFLANHFATQGPRLARNLVVASEKNAWLRRKLEVMASGGAAAIQMATLVGLGVGVVAYTAPPIIYVFNVKVSPAARLLFEIPPYRDGRPAPPPPAHAAASQAA